MVAHMFPLNNKLNEGMENNNCNSDYASFHKAPVPLTSDYVTKTTHLKLCKVTNLLLCLHVSSRSAPPPTHSHQQRGEAPTQTLQPTGAHLRVSLSENHLKSKRLILFDARTWNLFSVIRMS